MRFAIPGLLAALAAIAQPAAAEPVETAQGQVEVASAARVAVMDVAAIDTLAALGVTPAGVPDKLYVGYLADIAAKATPIGTLFEPNLERLATLSPDLIVVGGRSVAQKDALAQVAPVIDMTIGADVPGDARKRIAAYGALFGKGEKAAELTATLDDKLARLKAAGEGKGSALIVMTNGPKMSAYGEGSRFGWLYDVTGLPQVGVALDASANHGDAISHEFIAQANPDWLFVLDRGAAIGADEPSAQATLDNELVRRTNAWKNGNVVYLPADNVYLAPGGYTALSETLDALTAALAG